MDPLELGKRPRPDTDDAADTPESDRLTALKVASAYDTLKDAERRDRNASQILHLKKFNNWVKFVLISFYAPNPCSSVLDLACGKLGDLHKWKRKGVNRYCGIDISRQAVEDATNRFNKSRGAHEKIVAKLVRADLGCTDLTAAGVFAPNEMFDAISIQFALHYLFQTERRALTFFRNIADRLAPGACFVGTIPDAAYLVRRIRDLPKGVTRFGNSIYYIEFDEETVRRVQSIGTTPYGIRYTFFLAESVHHVDEYLVPWELLVRLAASVGLQPVACDNFHQFYDRMKKNPEYAQLLQSMGVLDVNGTMSPEEWEVCGVYRVFAFRKPLDPNQEVDTSQSRHNFAPDNPRRLSLAEQRELQLALPPMSVLCPVQTTKVHTESPMQYTPHLSIDRIADLIGE